MGGRPGRRIKLRSDKPGAAGKIVDVWTHPVPQNGKNCITANPAGGYRSKMINPAMGKSVKWFKMLTLLGRKMVRCAPSRWVNDR